MATVDIQVRGDLTDDQHSLLVNDMTNKAIKLGGKTEGAQSGGGCGCTGAEYFYEFSANKAARKFALYVRDLAGTCYVTMSRKGSDTLLRIKDAVNSCHQNIAKSRDFVEHLGE